jgi:cell division protein FtsA
MKGKNEIIAGLDIGGKKISVIVGEVKEDASIAVLGVWQQPSDGVRDGTIVNVELAANAIRRAINSAETNTGYNIDYVQVGIADNRLEGVNSFSVVLLEDGEVSKNEIQTALEIAGTIKHPDDRQVLLTISQYYSVDGEISVSEPLGAQGVRLELFAHLLTCTTIAKQNTLLAMEKVGLRVSGFSAKHIAAALAVSSPSEREAGVLLLDVGESGTGVALYKDSFLKHSALLPLGAKDITTDIAKGLKISEMEALRVKERFGCAFLQMVRRDAQIEVCGIGASEGRQISQRRLALIIEARLEEIMSFAYEVLSKKTGLPDLPGGVILTGASASMDGVVELASRTFGTSARIGAPQGLSGLAELAGTPQYATAAGLLMECASKLGKKRHGAAAKSKVNWVGNKIKSLVADFL